jgi:hypothetical protein
VKINVLVIGLLVLLHFAAFAQGDFRAGYIIKNNNDSIPGLVDYTAMRISYRVCVFKESKRGKKQKFSPEELKSYGFIKDRRYESKSVKIADNPTKKVFIEVIVKGNASLYLHEEVFYFEKDSVVKLPKNDWQETPTETGHFLKENKKYVGILNAEIFDCDLSADKTKYKQSDLVNLIQNYNRCKGGEGLIYKKHLPWTKVDFQVFTGFSTSNLKVDGFASNTFRPSRTVAGGGSIDLSFPRLKGKILLSLEAWYGNNLYQGYAESLESNGGTRKDIFIDVSFVKIPFSIRYNLLDENQTPYFKFGFVQYNNRSAQLKTITEQEVNGVVTTSSEEGELNGKSQHGFWLGAGYTKVIYSRLKIFSELRFEQTNGFLGSTIQSSASITSLQVLLGLRF